jgi:hypothetical protein
MKNVRKLVVILGILALTILETNAGLCRPNPAQLQASDAGLCRPTPAQLQACEDAGGYFDYGLCLCLIP